MKRTMLALLVIAVQGTNQSDRPDPRFTQQAERQAEESSKRILSEIGRLGNAHAWAGSYFMGSGLGNVVLQLAPDSGFVLHETGCLGVYDRD